MRNQTHTQKTLNWKMLTYITIHTHNWIRTASRPKHMATLASWKVLVIFPQLLCFIFIDFVTFANDFFESFRLHFCAGVRTMCLEWNVVLFPWSWIECRYGLFGINEQCQTNWPLSSEPCIFRAIESFTFVLYLGWSGFFYCFLFSNENSSINQTKNEIPKIPLNSLTSLRVCLVLGKHLLFLDLFPWHTAFQYNCCHLNWCNASHVFAHET